MPQVVPMLQYPDAAHALEMLSDVLGLAEVEEHRIQENGVITHAQLGDGAVRIFVASVWEAGGFVAPDARHASSFGVVSDARRCGGSGACRHLRRGDFCLQPGPTGELFRWTDPQGQRWLIAAE